MVNWVYSIDWCFGQLVSSPIIFINIFLLLFLIFSLFIVFIGVKLVNKIIQVLGANSTTYHLYTVVCVHHPSQVSVRHHFYLPHTLLHLPSPPAITTLLPMSMSFFYFLLNPSTIPLKPSPTPNSCHPALYLCRVCLYFVVS